MLDFIANQDCVKFSSQFRFCNSSFRTIYCKLANGLCRL